MEDLVVRLAKCCNPILGDPVVGYITRGRGISIHRVGCHVFDEIDIERQVDVEWNYDLSFRYPVKIKVISHDKPGVLSTISKTINGIGVNIKSASVRSTPDRKGNFIFEVEVKDSNELSKIINLIESLDSVISVTRS